MNAPNKALASDQFTAIHNGTIRLYADGRLRRIENGDERIQRRTALDTSTLNPEDRETFAGWCRAGDELNRKMGY